MFKYKHGRGCFALNAGLSLRHRDWKEKNNTSYNRFQKIISMLSVCLTIEAILCFYGRRGKTDWLTGRHTGSWLENQANPQLFFTQTRKKICTISNKHMHKYCLSLFVNSLALSSFLQCNSSHNAYLWMCSSMIQQCSWVTSHIKQIPNL